MRSNPQAIRVCAATIISLVLASAIARIAEAGPTGEDCNGNEIADVAEVPAIRLPVESYIEVGGEPVGVETADFDEDGMRDLLVFMVPPTVAVWLNRGDHFALAWSDTLTQLPADRVIADLNADGFADLALVLDDSNLLTVRLNGGDGTFATTKEIVFDTAPTRLAAGDYDADLDLDLFVSPGTDHAIRVLQNDGAGTFSQVSAIAQSANPQALVSGPIDADAAADLVVAGQASFVSRILRSLGDGSFQTIRLLSSDATFDRLLLGDFDDNGVADVVGSDEGSGGQIRLFLNPATDAGVSAIVVPSVFGRLGALDLNGDGILDLFQSGPLVPNVLLGKGDGSFQQFELLHAYSGLSGTGGDLDGDGLPELIAPDRDQGRLVVLRGGTEGFVAPRRVLTGSRLHHRPNRIRGADMNSDGLPELIAAYATEDVVTVRENLGGAFGPPRGIGGGTPPNSFAVADLDDDGLGDVVIANLIGSAVKVYTQTPTHFRLEATLVVPGVSFPVLADIDGDGHQDLIADSRRDDDEVVCVTRDVLNFGSLKKEEYPVPGTITGLAAGDLDADGDIDLVVTAPTLMVMLNRSDGTFEQPVDLNVGRAPVILDDIDADGRLDIVATDESGRSVLTRLSLPDPVLFVSNALPGNDRIGSLAATDYDGDGDADLVAAGPDVHFFTGTGNGRFFLADTFELSNHLLGPVVVADLDGDGIDEIGALDPSNGQVLFLPIEPLAGTSADCNADQIPDECETFLIDCDSDGVLDECQLDSDSDHVPDTCDLCPAADDLLDTDEDGSVDCQELCDVDPLKTVPGSCGCGVVEVDNDADSIPDCIDSCPGIFDPEGLDQDGDGTGDVCDACPLDPTQVDESPCGCGGSRVDSDLDGVPDCVDECPTDRAKSNMGICGCFVPEIDVGDVDQDGVANCNDNCPLAANDGQADSDDDGLGDVCDRLSGPNCTADCDGNLTVRQNDIGAVVRGVFDGLELAVCVTADADHDGVVRAHEIILGILEADTCLPPMFVPNPQETTEFLVTAVTDVSSTLGPSLDLCAHVHGVVLVWLHDQETLLGQQLNSAGLPLGDSLRVDVDGVRMTHIAVGCADDGSFLAIWYAGGSLLGRIVGADGVPVGAPFEIAAPTPLGGGRAATVTGDGNGRYLVTWIDSFATGQTISNRVFGQVFDSSGTPRGGRRNLGIGGSTSGARKFDAELRPNGEFLVLRLPSNVVEEYDMLGRPTGSAFMLDPPQNINRDYATLASTDDGTLVAAWTEDRNTIIDPRVVVQAFAPGGAPLGAAFRVSTEEADQRAVATVPIADDKVVVAWLQPEQEPGVWGRLYSTSTGVLEAVVRLNHLTSASSGPLLASTSDGGFLAFWRGRDGLGGSGIFGRRFDANAVSVSRP